MERVCVVLVNYKTWQDTANCIESLLRCQSRHIQVVVVENDSPDDSWQQLQDWAAGKVLVDNPEHQPLRHLYEPPVPKPISFKAFSLKDGFPTQVDEPLVLIQSDKNRGFAGGNNVGLKYMMAGQFSHAWLLNNDTVIEPDAIQALLDFDRQHAGTKMGIIGSKLRLFHNPSVLQGLGARFNPKTGTSHIIGAQQEDHGQFDQQIHQITYAIGAAMFVSKSFLEHVGLMSEDYFLYNEENDWSARALQKGWQVGVAANSIVYHKQGASTGNSPKKSKWQITALQYKYRGKILLYKRYYKKYMIYLYMHLWKRSFRYLLKGNFREAAVIYRAMLGIK